MTGTIVNTAAIIIGSSLGALLKRGFIDRYRDPLTKAIGLAALALGMSMIVKNMGRSDEPVLFIICLALGCIIGTSLKISERVDRLGERSSRGGSRLIEGLTTAVLLFCIGTLSILGPVESALNGDHSLLFTNAMLDLVTSFILASTYGIGIIISAPILFCWQGGIYLASRLAGSVVTDPMMVQVSIIGGILIFATGLGVLDIKKIKTLDYLPAIFLPVIYFLIRG